MKSCSPPADWPPILFSQIMPPKVRRLAIMGQPSVAQLQQGAVHVRESKLRKALEKDEAKGWISIKKKMKKKKMDKKKEVHYYIFYISLWPSFLLPSQEPKKVKAEAMKKEEDPESILMNLISMPSGSSLTFPIFSSSIQRESEEEAEAAGWQGLRNGGCWPGCGFGCWCSVLRGEVGKRAAVLCGRRRFI